VLLQFLAITIFFIHITFIHISDILTKVKLQVLIYLLIHYYHPKSSVQRIANLLIIRIALRNPIPSSR